MRIANRSCTVVGLVAVAACGGAVAVGQSAAAERGADDWETPAYAHPSEPDAGDAQPVSASRASAKRRAARRLSNKMFTRFTSSGESSFDQRLHLCRDKSFIYDTVSSAGDGGDPDVRRVEGRWRVTSARIRGRRWSARVRGTPSDGSGAISVMIRTNGKRVTIDGNLMSAERSDLC